MILKEKQLGNYRILHLIGNGCRGEVYLAEGADLQEQMALKVVQVETLPSDQHIEALRAFLSDAAAAARLHHPAIQPLADHGKMTLEASTIAYLITPYRPAGSLATWLQQPARNEFARQVTISQVSQIIQQTGAALQTAHDHQIMHLALKPTNLLIGSEATIDQSPGIFLSDFGISHLARENARNAPAYLAPEQLNGQPECASDQYALGILAYELLAGQPPFQGTPENIISAHLQETPPAVCASVPALPVEIDQVLQRALAKEPSTRFPSVSAFVQAFQTTLQDIPSTMVLRELDPPEGKIEAGTNDIPDTEEHIPPLPDDKPEIIREHAFTDTSGIEGYIPLSSDDPAISPSGNSLSEVDDFHEKMEETDVEVVAQDDPGGQSNLETSSEFPSDETFQNDPDLLDQPIDTPDEPFAYQPGTLPATDIPAEPRRKRSPVTIAAMILLLLVGGGICASGVINNWPGLHNKAEGQALSISNGQNRHITATSTRSTPGTATPGSAVAATARPTATPLPITLSWQARQSGMSQDLLSLAWADTRFVAVGTHGSVLISPDGLTWTPEHSGVSQDLWDISWSGNILVAVGTAGTIITSPNGVTWTVQHSGVSQDLWSVTYSDGYHFIATGTGGTILTSTDGITWTLHHSNPGLILDVAVWSGSLKVVVGENGTILTSPDGSTWTVQHSSISQLFEAVTWSKSQFVIVGENGTILTSPDGSNWTIQHSQTTQNLGGVGLSGSQ